MAGETTAARESLSGDAGADSAFQRFREARDFLIEHRENWDAARSSFQWPMFDDFNWALDWFDRMADGNDGIALWIVDDDGGEVQLTFAELAERSARVANLFRSQGIARGDRILVMLPNVAPLWEIMLACIKLGAVVIPTSTLLTGDDIDDRLRRGGAAHIIVAHDQTHKFQEIDAAINRFSVGGQADGWHCFEDAYHASSVLSDPGTTRADDPMLLYFTSGTSNRPKLVLHSHRSYPVGHLSTMYWLGLQPGGVHLNISSPGWAKHAWSCLFAPWNAEATVLTMNHTRFSASAMLDVMARCGVTSVCAPATVWRMLVQEDLTSRTLVLREAASAGEPLNPEIIDTIRQAWGLTIRDGFGQTETTAIVGNSPGQAVIPGSMGRALPGYDVILVDEDGREVEEGEISVRMGPTRPAGILMGYQGEGLHLTPPGTDLYRTGDVGRRDRNGWITYVGRADDVFKSSDYRISPFELESALIEHPAIMEAAVVPYPDPIRLTLPKAFICLAAPHAPSREMAMWVFAHLQEALAPYKRIRRIEFVEELPKTSSGKIKRVELRASEAKRLGCAKQANEWFLDEFPEIAKAAFVQSQSPA